MKRISLILLAALLIPVFFLGWLATTQSGLNWAWRQAEFYLPVQLYFSQLEGSLIGPVTVKDFEYRQDGVSVNARQITVDWHPAALLAANINISQFYIESLNIDLAESAKTKQQPTEAENQAIILPEISLPWRLVLKNAEIDGFSFGQKDQAFKLKKITLNATTLFSTINIKQLDIDADTFSLASKGKLQPTHDYSHELDLSWQLTLPNSEIIKGQGKLSGNMQKTHLRQTLSGPLQLTLDAHLNSLLTRLNWTASASIKQFDLTKLDAELPALSGAARLDASGDLARAKLTGNMHGKYAELGKLDADLDVQRLADNTIQIDRLLLQAPQTDTRLNASGSWQPGDNAGNIKLALDWQNLLWPSHNSPWFNSAKGSASIEGSIDKYQVILDTDSPWPQTAPSSWHASASGNRDGMKFHTLRINALNGEANISGKLNWSPRFSWQAEGEIANIDPAALWPEWSGRLNGRLTSDGRMENDQIIAKADISQIKGEIRGYPVSLQSRLAWRDNHLDIAQLNYISGQSQVELTGKLGETLDLDWSVSSNELAELYPEAGGQLQAKGRLKGPASTPLLETSFTGKNLSYPGIEVGTGEAQLSVELFRWQKVDIQLTAQSLSFNNVHLLSADINTDDQDITARFVSSQATAQIELSGKPDTTGWHGRIEKANVDSDYFDNWQLDNPVPFSIAENILLSENMCWHSNQQASLCASLNQSKASWLASIKMTNVPLKLFEHWLPSELTIVGMADATAKLEYQPPETLLAQLDVLLAPGTVNYPMISGESNQREYSAGSIQLTLNALGLNASTEITMANGDRLTAQTSLPGFKPLAGIDPSQPLTASARLHATDLRLVEAFFHEIYNMQGELNIQLGATGTVERPLISANAKIANGTMQIPGLGLNINQLTLSGQSLASRKFNFRLDAHSGDGKLEITGHTLLDHNAGWPTEINITGNDFEAAHIPEARLYVSPDLQIKLKNRRIDVKGKVHIPYAKLQPRDITLAENISSDTVIIGSDQASEERWLIHTSVRLTLGERVHFYGFGFEGRLGGSLLLEDEPGQLTRATGEITIPEGNYRAYGQRLDVEHGRILYTGGPLTNPGLDIRAVRKVDTVTAGIHVKGSLNQPQLEIFSSPAMSQTDALAYILLGGPIENASNEDGAMMAKAALALGLSGGDTIARSLADRFGLDDMRVESSSKGDQAALVVGRYLSPKIYVSYGLGLIDSVNILTIRYQISKKWLLKVESGEYQGADFFYTIER